MPVRNNLARKVARRRPDLPSLTPIGQPFDVHGAATAFARNEEIFGEGEPAEYLYQVVSGCVRTYTTLKDGRRQIGAFYLPGDIFGLEARKLHHVSAEAITRAKLQAIKISDLMSQIARSILMYSLPLDLTTQELHRTQKHILLLLMSAQQRVVGFLFEMALRADRQGEIELPMSRQDIADYLGLTIETVSRTLTRLELAEAISLPSSRSVILRNRPALNRLMN